jgi:hypothetical protein
MLSFEILLRQKYSLSFLTTTLLITLTTQSSLAFSINPLRSVTPIENWDTEERYTLPDHSKGITTLGSLRSLTRGGTTAFLGTLSRNFSSWNFNSASNDLEGSFDVLGYDAIGRDGVVGGALGLEYKPGAGDPTPQDNTLHWIQRVFSNHKLPDIKDENHGKFEDIIDIGFGVTTPFYDALTDEEIKSGKPPLPEGIFSDFSRRGDIDKNHSWLAELYLVEQTAPRQVTIYNGIGWDWGNRVEPVPEPLTIFGSGMGLGLGVLFKKKVQGNRKKQKATKS